MSGPEDSATVFKRLSLELRKFWTDLNGVGLYFEIFCPGHGDSSNPDPRTKERATLCFVNLPLTCAITDFTISSGWVFVAGLKRDDARIKRLRKLFREAGTHLPSDYLIRLRGYMHLIKDPVSLWVALLCYVRGIHTCQCQRWNPEEHAGKNWNIWYVDEHIVNDPIQFSIEVIEQLRLNTDSPVPLCELNVEQPWPPDSADREAEAPRDSGLQVSSPVESAESRDQIISQSDRQTLPKRKRARRQARRQLTAKQEKILKVHKPGQKHEETAKQAGVFDQFRQPDTALVKTTLKAFAEYKARQENRR